MNAAAAATAGAATTGAHAPPPPPPTPPMLKPTPAPDADGPAPTSATSTPARFTSTAPPTCRRRTPRRRSTTERRSSTARRRPGRRRRAASRSTSTPTSSTTRATCAPRPTAISSSPRASPATLRVLRGVGPNGRAQQVGGLRARSQAAVRHRVLPARPGSAVGLRRQHRLGLALSLSQRRPDRARPARGHQRPDPRRRPPARRRPLDARHRLPRRRQEDVRVGRLALEQRRHRRQLRRVPSRRHPGDEPRRQRHARLRLGHPQPGRHRVLPAHRRAVDVGQRARSPGRRPGARLHHARARRAASTAGPGTTSAATSIRATPASTPSCATR